MINLGPKVVEFVFLSGVLFSILVDNGVLTEGSSARNANKSNDLERKQAISKNTNHSSLLNKQSMNRYIGTNSSIRRNKQTIFEGNEDIIQTPWLKGNSKYLGSNISQIDELDPESTLFGSMKNNTDNEPLNYTMLHQLEKIEVLRAYLLQNQMSANTLMPKPHQNKSINPFHSIQNFSKFLNKTFFEEFFGSPFPIQFMNKSFRHHQMASSMASFDELYPPWENLTEEEQRAFLNFTLGSPQMYGRTGTYGLGTYYSALLFIGIPGNGLTCLIILTNSYMRTAPNIFLFNIALADLVTLITVVPMEISTIFKAYPWRLGEFGCDMATIACELTTHVLILTMIAFSIERYFAICHPLKPSFQSSKRRTLRICILIWILSLAPSVFWSSYSKEKFLFYSRSEPPRHEFSHFESPGFVKIESSAMCMVSPRIVSTTMATMAIVTTTMLYLLPIMILPFIYSRIANALKDSETYSRASGGSGSVTRNRKTVVRMQMAVLICFLVCWTPYHVQRIMFVFVTKTDTWTSQLFETAEVLHVVSGCCYFLSSTINPFLYSLLSKRFRRGYYDLKYKMKNYLNSKVPFLNTSTHTSSRIQNAPIPMISLNRNQSLKFYTKKIQSRNTMQRHFGKPASWTAHCAEDEWKAKVLGIPGIARHNNEHCSPPTFQPVYKSKKVEMIRIENDNSSHRNVSESSALKISKPKRDCKYRVSFKSHNNADTTLLVNNYYRKIDYNTKQMQRCSPIYDLRNIGESSTVLCLRNNRLNQSFKVNCNTLVEDEEFRNRRHFLSNSHSFRI